MNIRYVELSSFILAPYRLYYIECITEVQSGLLKPAFALASSSSASIAGDKLSLSTGLFHQTRLDLNLLGVIFYIKLSMYYAIICLVK